MKRSLFSRLFLFLSLVFFSQNISAQYEQELDIALQHLKAQQKKLNLTEHDISNYIISDLYQSKHNGVTHVYLKQTYNGIEVFNAITNINILPNGKVLNMGNRFVSDLQSNVNNPSPSIGAGIALQRVMDEFEIRSNAPLELKEQLSENSFLFKNENLALVPIPVKLVYQKTEGNAVKLAWQVEFYQLDANHWWNVRIDAHTGEKLKHHDQVIHCNFDTPYSDGCTDHVHLGKTIPNQNTNQEIGQNIVVPNSYAVIAMPLESPNHGPISLEVNPADPDASPHGWHDTDNQAGPEFTITRGNNAHAYQDIFDLNASIGDEPDGGPDLEFDMPVSFAEERPYTRAEAAVVNLFYWNNVIHDVWYQYGFDERAGNFQSNNYGNGGTAGDWVRAEALDGSGTSNANFGTGADGSQARMQMYYWGNEAIGGLSLNVTAPESVMGTYDMAAAGFGGDLPSPAIASELILIDDEVGISSDGCQPLVNGVSFEGKIAMIDRGECEFGFKVRAAENAGAIAVVVCNNVAPGTIPMGGGAVGGQVNIPSAMISLQDCNTLKTALGELEVEFGFPETQAIPLPGPQGRDSDFDNGIIVHEYGHGISIRLTGGPSTGSCLTNTEQAGEGWSDWFGLVMQTTAADTPEEGRGIGTYATNQATNGGGIRQFRYSRNMNINPHTYANVPGVAVPHGVGSVWAVMIWDMYWNLVEQYGFDDDYHNGTGGNNIAMQLVLDGLKLQPCDPSFVESRDAIIAADEANNEGANVCLIWQTFARRGLGDGAEEGGVQSFEIPDLCDLTLKIEKTAAAQVEAGNVLTYTLAVRNDSGEDQGNVKIVDVLPAGTSYREGSSTIPNTVVDGNTLVFELGSVSTAASNTYTYEVEVANEPFSFAFFQDNIESGLGNWFVSSDLTPDTWTLDTGDALDGTFALYAEGSDAPTDQYLTFSSLITVEGSNPVLSFWHKYNMETGADGAVVEVSTNSGQSWNDLGSLMFQNGYEGLINSGTSPINGRQSFTGNSDGYVHTLISMINFLNQDIVVRWRFATDEGTLSTGWHLDDIKFFGNYYSITNEACISSNTVESKCAEANTIVFEGETTSTKGFETNLDITISPNPAKTFFNINLESATDQSVFISLLNIDGKEVGILQKGRSNDSFNVDVSALSAGIYLVNIQTDTGNEIRKIVIE